MTAYRNWKLSLRLWNRIMRRLWKDLENQDNTPSKRYNQNHIEGSSWISENQNAKRNEKNEAWMFYVLMQMKMLLRVELETMHCYILEEINLYFIVN